MVISKEMQSAINNQINAEMYSAYLYLSMSANFEDMNLPGFANWMKVQAQEEMTHAMKFYGYVTQRGGRVILDKIDKPKEKWSSALDAFEDAYLHERKVTSMINNLADIAEKEKDRATLSMLQWFIDEQVEEEANAEGIVQKLKLADNAPGAIFMIDKELSSRVFVDETASSE